MTGRQSHQEEVQRFLQAHFHTQGWQFSLPHGWGHETYFANCGDQAYFIKLGVQCARYQAAATLGLTPEPLDQW